LDDCHFFGHGDDGCRDLRQPLRLEYRDNVARVGGLHRALDDARGRNVGGGDFVINDDDTSEHAAAARVSHLDGDELRRDLDNLGHPRGESALLLVAERVLGVALKRDAASDLGSHDDGWGRGRGRRW